MFKQSLLSPTDLALPLGSKASGEACFLPTLMLNRGWEDEDGPEIVDVGQRGPGHDLVTERLEEAVTIVIGQAHLRSDTARLSSGNRIGRHDCPGHFLRAVDAIGIGGKREHAGQPVQLDREGKQELHVASAPTISAHRHDGFAARWMSWRTSATSDLWSLVMTAAAELFIDFASTIRMR